MAATELVHSVNAADAMKAVTLTIRIKGLSLQRIRVCIGVLFIKIAVKIIGCGVKIEDE